MNISNIVIKDASGKDVTFSALVPQSGTIPAKWVSRQGARALQPNLTALVQPRSQQSIVDKTTIKFQFPVKDAVTQALAYTYNCELTVLAPRAGTDAELDNVIVQLQNLLNSTQVTDILKNVAPAV